MVRILQKVPLPIWFALSGALMGAAFTRWYLWWMVFFGLMLFIWSLTRTQSCKRAFLLGWLAGSVKLLLVYVWVWSIYPLSWAGIDSATAQIAFIAAYWLLLSIVPGLGLGGVAAAFVFLRRHNTRKALLFFPFLLIGGESIGALLYALLTFASDVGISHIYTHGYTGLTLADHSVLKWGAVLGGVYALTCIVGTIASVVYAVARRYTRQTRLQQFGACSAGVLVIVFGFISLSPFSADVYSNGKRIAVVTTAFTREMVLSQDQFLQYAKQKMLAEGVRAALKESAEVIVLPESARFTSNMTDEEVFTLLESNGAREVVLIDNVAREQDGATTLSILTYDTKTRTVYQYDKQNLIAFGEYVPALVRPVLDRSDKAVSADELFGSLRFAAGVSRSSVTLPDHVPSTLFCGDVGEPWSARAITKARGEQDFIAYTASHAWFASGNPISGRNQLDWMLKVHALWSDAHIIEAANMAPSAHYRPDGTLGAFTPIYQDSHIRVDMAEI